MHISPGVTLCGNVKVGEGSFIGASSTVIQNVKIGKNCGLGPSFKMCQIIHIYLQRKI